MLYAWFSISFIFQLHILLPGKLSRVLKLLAESSKRCCGTAAKMSRIMQNMRVIQLLVTQFNVGHRNVIYCVNLLCIIGATVNGYGAIAHGKSGLSPHSSWRRLSSSIWSSCTRLCMRRHSPFLMVSKAQSGYSLCRWRPWDRAPQIPDLWHDPDAPESCL